MSDKVRLFGILLSALADSTAATEKGRDGDVVQHEGAARQGECDTVSYGGPAPASSWHSPGPLGDDYCNEGFDMPYDDHPSKIRMVFDAGTCAALLQPKT
jgi:hypothetical protein